MTPEQKTVLAFIERINAADVAGVIALLAEPHIFIDSLGHVLKGDRKTLTGVWRGYYTMVPDYHIEVEEILQDGETLMVVGRASGTVADKGELIGWMSSNNGWSSLNEETKVPTACR